MNLTPRVFLSRRKQLLALALVLGTTAGAGEPSLSAAPVESSTANAARAWPADDPLPAGAIARLGSRRLRHSGLVNCVAFSPDGKILASGGHDALVRFWDVATGKPLRVFADYSSFLRALAFSPDGTTLATTEWGAEKNALRLRDANSGVERYRVERPPVGTFRGCGGPVAFSPDGKVLAGSDAIGQVLLWDSDTGRKKCILGKHDHDNVIQAVFSPDGRTLATCGQDATIRVWDVVRQKPRFVLRSADTWVPAILFSRDGKQLISGGGAQESPNIRVWDVATGKQLRVLTESDLRGHVASLALSPDGRTLAVSSSDKVRLWDLAEGKPLRELPGGRNIYGPARSLCFSPDGKLLAGAISHAVALWETASGRLLTPDAAEPASAIHAVAVSHSGRLLAVGDGDGFVALWDLPSRKPLHRIHAHKYVIDQIVFSSDDKWLATSSPGESVRLWDAGAGRLLRQLPPDAPKDSRRTCLIGSPDGKLLADAYFFMGQGAGPRGIRLWDAAAGREVQNLAIGDAVHAWFVSINFSADGRRLYGTTVGGDTYGWRNEGGRFVPQGVIHEGVLHGSAAHSPDGLLVRTHGSRAGALEFWDFQKRTRKWTLTGLRDAGGRLSFSPDGRYLASGPRRYRGGSPSESGDGMLQVYEMASGQEVQCWPLPPRMTVISLAFTPDNRALVGGMSDSTTLIWEVFPTARAIPDDLPALWADLAHADARRAHRAVVALRAAGEKAVAFLDRRLEPARPPDPERLARWIADLDSDQFAVREKAMSELSKVAGMVRPALTDARSASPSLELRRRIDRLLEGIDDPVPPADVLRGVRAVAVLEYLATPPARRRLQRLGEGAPEARLTEEAKAALRRLARR